MNDIIYRFKAIADLRDYIAESYKYDVSDERIKGVLDSINIIEFKTQPIVKWIPVEQKFPDVYYDDTITLFNGIKIDIYNSDNIFVTTSDNIVLEAYYQKCSDEKNGFYEIGGDEIAVVAWMPILKPKPYKRVIK